MIVTEFTPISSFVGGVLIGLAAVLFLIFNGRIAGISGILSNVLFSKSKDRILSGFFILGLLVGGVILYQTGWMEFPSNYSISFYQIALAGLLVGLGTRLGSGCTSGHGVCGISRLSPRSIVATLVFILAGMVVVWLIF